MAPVAYFGIYVISVIIAVVPATFLNFLGGAMFGWWQGALLSWTANILGAFIAIWLFRGVARSVVHIFFPERKLERFQKFVRKRGWAYLFILYMVPAPPGDVLNFASAASDIRLYKLIIMIAIARLPVIIGRSIIGTSMVSFNVLQWIILGASLFVVLGLVYLLRNQINSLAERFSARFFPLPANRNKSIDKQ
jgi:uncharacterized membrane protein YdjX (TVP38/TMEM64 family)